MHCICIPTWERLSPGWLALLLSVHVGLPNLILTYRFWYFSVHRYIWYNFQENALVLLYVTISSVPLWCHACLKFCLSLAFGILSLFFQPKCLRWWWLSDCLSLLVAGSPLYNYFCLLVSVSLCPTLFLSVYLYVSVYLASSLLSSTYVSVTCGSTCPSPIAYVINNNNDVDNARHGLGVRVGKGDKCL